MSESQLEEIERRRDPAMIPHLTAAVRQLQHELDGLRLSLEVARRDREELRGALLAARDEISRLGGADEEEPTEE